MKLSMENGSRSLNEEEILQERVEYVIDIVDD